jgi:hypothetical protein
MKKPVVKVRPYRHSKTHKFLLDLHAFGKGRMFFKTRAEADAERMRQLTMLERHGREAIGLSQRELSDFITAKRDLAEYGKTINDTVEFFVDHLQRVVRHGITVAKLANEVVEAKRRDGRSPEYIADLRLRLSHFCRDFGTRPIAGITETLADGPARFCGCVGVANESPA